MTSQCRGQTLTLADFLLARIDEDEVRDGQRRIRPTGTVTCPCGESGHLEHGPQDGYDRPNLGITHVVGWNQPAVVAGEVVGHGESSTVTHVLTGADVDQVRATWPLTDESRRVLAECEAKRVRLGVIEQMRITGTVPSEKVIAAAAAVLLKLEAFPYSDHPDYREEWRP